MTVLVELNTKHFVQKHYFYGNPVKEINSVLRAMEIDLPKKSNIRTRSGCSQQNSCVRWTAVAVVLALVAIVTCSASAVPDITENTLLRVPTVLMCDNVNSVIRIGGDDQFLDPANHLSVLPTFSADNCDEILDALPIVGRPNGEVLVSFKDFVFGQSVGAFLCVSTLDKTTDDRHVQHLGLSSVFYPLR